MAVFEPGIWSQIALGLALAGIGLRARTVAAGGLLIEAAQYLAATLSVPPFAWGGPVDAIVDVVAVLVAWLLLSFYIERQQPRAGVRW